MVRPLDAAAHGDHSPSGSDSAHTGHTRSNHASAIVLHLIPPRQTLRNARSRSLVALARVRQHCTGTMPPSGSVVPSTRTTVIAYLPAISVEV
jgi:hypothetical protein